MLYVKFGNKSKIYLRDVKEHEDQALLFGAWKLSSKTTYLHIM